MRDRQAIRRLIAASLVAVGFAGAATAQPYRQQGISPIFDGWEELPDHTRLFYFGYINRANTEVTIPVGPANGFGTAPADRGQPTSFLPGRHRHVFTIQSTNPKAKLTWTVTTTAGVQTANASFDLLYILEERENENPNARPPVIAAAPVVAKVGEAVRLAPQVTAATGGHAAAVEGTVADADGLTIYWSKYRGPGAVTFSEVPGAPKPAAPQSRRAREAMAPGVFVSHCGDKAGAFCGSAVVSFSVPGEYLLRAAARQEEMQGLAFVRVTVNP